MVKQFCHLLLVNWRLHFCKHGNYFDAVWNRLSLVFKFLQFKHSVLLPFSITILPLSTKRSKCLIIYICYWGYNCIKRCPTRSRVVEYKLPQTKSLDSLFLSNVRQKIRGHWQRALGWKGYYKFRYNLFTNFDLK